MSLSLAVVLAMPLCSQAERSAETPVQVTYARRTIVDFSAMKLLGEIERPDNSFVMVRRSTRFDSLVRVRGDFIPELLASVDQL